MNKHLTKQLKTRIPQPPLKNRDSFSDVHAPNFQEYNFDQENNRRTQLAHLGPVNERHIQRNTHIIEHILNMLRNAELAEK